MNEITENIINTKQEHISSEHYIEGSYVINDENEGVEFKGHRDMTMKDVSENAFFKEGDKLLMSHQPISRTFCSFLNTGSGGVIHIGILDDGKIVGVKLTQHQRDHMVLSMKSLAAHFIPPVGVHQYELCFVPVIKEEADLDNITRDSGDPVKRPCSHIIETPKFCWCDKEAKAKENLGMTSNKFVIQIKIKPFDHNDPRNSHLIATEMPLNPIYQNEEGLCYIRFQGSIIKYDLDQIVEMTRQKVRSYYENKLNGLLQELDKECDSEITCSKGMIENQAQTSADK